MTAKCEYKIVYINADRWTSTGLPTDLNRDFDEWGSQGWDLVSTEAIIRDSFLGFGGRTVGLVAFFQRAVKP